MSCVVSSWTLERPYKCLFDKGVVLYVGYSQNQSLDVVLVSDGKTYYIAFIYNAPDNAYENIGEPQLLCHYSDCVVSRVLMFTNSLVLTMSDGGILWFISAESTAKARKWDLSYRLTTTQYLHVGSSLCVCGVHLSLSCMKLVYVASSVSDADLTGSSNYPKVRNASMYSSSMYESKSDRSLCLSPPICLAVFNDGVIFDTYATHSIFFILLIKEEKMETIPEKNRDSVYVYAYNLDSGSTARVAAPLMLTNLKSRPHFVSVMGSPSSFFDSCFVYIETEPVVYKVRWVQSSFPIALSVQSLAIPSHLTNASVMSVLAYTDSYTFFLYVLEEKMYLQKRYHASMSTLPILSMAIPPVKPYHLRPSLSLLHATSPTSSSVLPLLCASTGHLVSIHLGNGGGISEDVSMCNYLNSLFHVLSPRHTLCDVPPAFTAPRPAPNIFAPRGRKKKDIKELFPPPPTRPSVYAKYTQLMESIRNSPRPSPAHETQESISGSFEFLQFSHPITLQCEEDHAEESVLWCYHVLSVFDSLDLMDIVTYLLRPPDDPIHSAPKLLDALPSEPSSGSSLLSLILSYYLCIGNYRVPRALRALLRHLRHSTEDDGWCGVKRYRKVELEEKEEIAMDVEDEDSVSTDEAKEGEVDSNVSDSGVAVLGQEVSIMERFAWLHVLIQKSYRGRATQPIHDNSQSAPSSRSSSNKRNGRNDSKPEMRSPFAGEKEFSPDSVTDEAYKTTTAILENQLNQELTGALCVAIRRYLDGQVTEDYKQGDDTIAALDPPSAQLLERDSKGSIILPELIKLLLKCQQYLLVAHVLKITNHPLELYEYTLRVCDSANQMHDMYTRIYTQEDDEQVGGAMNDIFDYIPPMPSKCIQYNIQKYGEEKEGNVAVGNQLNELDAEGSLVMDRMNVAKLIFCKTLPHVQQMCVRDSPTDTTRLKTLIARKPRCLSVENVTSVVSEMLSNNFLGIEK